MTRASTNQDPPLLSPAPITSKTSDMNPLSAIFSLLLLLLLPVLIYAVCLVIKCPGSPFRQIGRSPAGEPPGELKLKKQPLVEFFSTLKYAKEEAETECPVCLSVFVAGEEIRQLNACKHMFHVKCIDVWLGSHSTCPVCRTFVPFKRSKLPVRGKIMGSVMLVVQPSGLVLGGKIMAHFNGFNKPMAPTRLINGSIELTRELSMCSLVSVVQLSVLCCGV
nr:RING-H2 finger protein ATL33-like [Ipomoea batatas]GMC99599.1 RING-H2 finger protein ATL33-like [Ipomoea batatas]GME17516.1 RING-H2 finger protein ATL33-like [Ipomoea batatas]